MQFQVFPAQKYSVKSFIVVVAKTVILNQFALLSFAIMLKCAVSNLFFACYLFITSQKLLVILTYKYTHM